MHFLSSLALRGIAFFPRNSDIKNQRAKSCLTLLNSRGLSLGRTDGRTVGRTPEGHFIDSLRFTREPKKESKHKGNKPITFTFICFLSVQGNTHFFYAEKEKIALVQ